MPSVWLLGWWQRKWHCPEPLVPTAWHWSLQSCPGRELGRSCTGPQSAGAGKELLRSGRGQSFTKNRELLWEAKEPVFLKRSYRAGWAVCCSPLTCSASILPAASPGPPSTIPQLSRPSVFFVSRKCSCWQALAAPSSSRRRGLGPSQPRLCAGRVAQGALRAPRPRRQGEQSGPRATHSPAASASPRAVSCGEAAAKRAAPRGCCGAQHGSLCSLQEARAGLAPAGRSALPSLLQAALVWGLLLQGSSWK